MYALSGRFPLRFLVALATRRFAGALGFLGPFLEAFRDTFFRATMSALRVRVLSITNNHNFVRRR